MNLVFHNLKKDVRHLRVLLFVWFALVILQVAMSGSGSSARTDDMAWQVTFQTLSFLVPALQAIVLIVALPLLIHDEPLVGTTAFWFTRPISRRALLSSKTLFVGSLLILLPLLAEIILLACNGVTLRHVLLAIPEILMKQCSLILPIAVLAVLTPTFARFAIIGASFFVAMMLITIAVSLVQMFLDPDSVLEQITMFSLTQSRGVIASIINIALGTTVVVHQYLTRRTSRSVCITAAGILLMFLAQQFWPWDFLATERIEVREEIIDTSNVTVSLDRDNIDISDTFQFRGTEDAKKQVMGRLEYEGLPPGFVAYPGQVSSVLTFSDGKRIESTEQDSAGLYSLGQWDMDVLQYVLGETTIVNADMDRFSYRSRNLFKIDQESYHTYAQVGGDLSLTVDFTAYKYEIVATLPLKKKSSYARGSKETIITDILRQSFGCTVVIRERTIALLFAEDARPYSPIVQLEQKNVKYVLCNRKRKEAFLPEDDGSVDFDIFGAAQRLKIRNQTLRFLNEDGRFTPAINDEWLADAELLRIEMVKVGNFTKDIHVEDFVMEQKPRWGRTGSDRKKEGPDPEALEKIKLPDNPTPKQVRSYIAAILRESRGQRRFSGDDPQVEMLSRVGGKHLDLLIEADDSHNSYYINLAVKNLAGEEHKDLILKNLGKRTQLVEIVIENDWVDDARDTLTRKIKTASYLPAEWIKIVASFKDPSTYDDLKSYLVKSGNRGATYDAIKRLPGIDLGDAVAKAWRKSKYASDYQMLPMLPVAMEFGHLDALEMAIRYSIEGADGNRQHEKQIRSALKKCVDITGTDAEIRDWFEKNKDNLRFDPEAKKFRVND